MTGKEILEKHGLHQLPKDEVEDMLFALREVAEIVWDFKDKAMFSSNPEIALKTKEEFINSLFPEEK